MRVVRVRVRHRATTVAVFDSGVWLRLPSADIEELLRPDIYSPEFPGGSGVVEANVASIGKPATSVHFVN